MDQYNKLRLFFLIKCDTQIVTDLTKCYDYYSLRHRPKLNSG